jgi:hypothetical protein
MDIFLKFMSSGPEWLTAICGVLTACTAITALTPTKSDDSILNTVLKVLNFLAGNVLKNKNKDA